MRPKPRAKVRVELNDHALAILARILRRMALEEAQKRREAS